MMSTLRELDARVRVAFLARQQADELLDRSRMAYREAQAGAGDVEERLLAYEQAREHWTAADAAYTRAYAQREQVRREQEAGR